MTENNPGTEYLRDAELNKPHITDNSGTLSWRCPSNIALVKYWGKREGQLPQNPSVSFTLKNAVTKISVHYQFSSDNIVNKHEFIFNGKQNAAFQIRVREFIFNTEIYFPFLKKLKLIISSENTFPHESGIASSASGFGALALALTELEYLLKGKQIEESFFQKASYIARIGSGSACRSIFGPFVLWGKINGLSVSSDYYAVPLKNFINPVFDEYRDSILIISTAKKAVSSSQGHLLMNSHPYAYAHFDQGVKHAAILIDAIKAGDLDTFIFITEQQALDLHAMMMTSNPGFLLMKPETLRVIDIIRNFRSDTGHPVCFTLDAGANVHLLYPGSMESEIMKFIDNELLVYCENHLIIHDSVGRGPDKTS